MRRLRRCEVVGDCPPLTSGGLGEPCPKSCIARVDTESRPGLGIGEPHLAHVDELLLARVPHLDRQHIVARREVDELWPPVAWPTKVRHHGDQGALPRDRAKQRQGGHQVGRRAPRYLVVAEREQEPDQSGASLPRPQRCGEPLPNERSPTRLPRTLAACPSASATPSATSALRRSAVPKPIEGVRSSTIQVTRTRSASCTRTCASLVRAVTFQSIRRTSSPGNVGPDLGQLAAPAEQVRAMVARKETVDATADRQLEGAQQRLRHRPGAGALGSLDDTECP